MALAHIKELVGNACPLQSKQAHIGPTGLTFARSGFPNNSNLKSDCRVQCCVASGWWRTTMSDPFEFIDPIETFREAREEPGPANMKSAWLRRLPRNGLWLAAGAIVFSMSTSPIRPSGHALGRTRQGSCRYRCRPGRRSQGQDQCRGAQGRQRGRDCGPCHVGAWARHGTHADRGNAARRCRRRQARSISTAVDGSRATLRALHNERDRLSHRRTSTLCQRGGDRRNAWLHHAAHA